MNPSPVFPSREEGFRLHDRLVDNDATACADICAAYVGPLTAWLAEHSCGADGHLVASAVHDALIAYVAKPTAYDPARGDLAAYLRMAARGDLRNLQRKEYRHCRLRISWNDVANGAEAGNISRKDKEPSEQLEQQEEEERRLRLFARAEEDCDPNERQILQLMREGEHSTRAAAAATGLEGSPQEQARRVKQMKDRIIKRMQRGGDHV